MTVKKLFALLLFISLPVLAASDNLRYETETGDSITLFSGACAAPELVKHIKAEALPKFQTGETFYKGKKYAACWMLAPDGVVYVIDTGESGVEPDVYGIPAYLFATQPSKAI